MSDDRFGSARRGPGGSKQSETVWPDWVRQEQAQLALAKEIEGMFVPVALRKIADEAEMQMAQPLPISFDRNAANAFIESELSWGELGGEFVQRFMPNETAAPQYSVSDLYDRITEERRYEANPSIPVHDLSAALDRATAVGILELAYRDNIAGADRVYRLNSQNAAQIDALTRTAWS